MNQHSENERQRFYLEPLTAEHLNHVAKWYENLDDLVLIESKLPLPVGAQALQKAWQNDFSQTEPRTNYLFSISGENGECVGHTGLQDINYAHGNGVVFVFVKKDRRRIGIALRSVALMLDVAFNQLRLHRLTTYVHANNVRSVSLIRRIGFQGEGCMREGCFFEGEFADVNVVGLLCREWQRARIELSDALDNKVTVSFGRNDETRWIWPLRRTND